MDRTSRIGLFVCLALLIGLEFTVDKFYPMPKAKPHAASTATVAATPANSPQITSAPGTPAAAPAPVPAALLAEKFTVVANDAMKVTFTSLGAAITEIELKQQRADNGGNILLNEEAHSNILALKGWPGVETANFQVQENAG